MLVTLRKRVEADNQSWKQFVYDYFDRPRKEIEQLMRHVAASRAVQAAVAAKPELARMSDREIAREIGVTHPTVAAARKAVGNNFPTEQSSSNSKPMQKRIGKDGKEYKATKPQQTKPKPPQQNKVQQQNKPQSAPKRITLLFDEPCTDCNTQQEQWHRSVSNMPGEAISLSAYWTQQFGNDWQKFEVASDVLTLAKQAAEVWNEIVEGMIEHNSMKLQQFSQALDDR
jgi:hypothetical protein